MTDIRQDPAAAAFKALLSSALSSDPGNTVVDLNGCYIAPLIQLLDAVTDGTADAAVLDQLKEKVLQVELVLARQAAAEEGP